MINICVLGASLGWTPGLVTDLMVLMEDRMEIRLADIDPNAAQLCAEWGETANRLHGRKDGFIPFSDRKKALEGADAVLVTLSTGGLDAMEHDIAIPEKYGIFATVGDTAGPGGWSRSIRNIPVFEQFAEDFDKICPHAFIVNYTNPMSSLTATLDKLCGNPVVGLCHSYFETKDVIQKIFGLDDWSKISIEIAGMNHFTWVVDFKIGREDGYWLLREKIGEGSLRDVLPKTSSDEIGMITGHNLCVELYDAFGYLPYPADRHTSEFVSFVLGGWPERFSLPLSDGKACDAIRYCGIKRTSVQQRRDWLPVRDRQMREMIGGEREMPRKSREKGADMIHAYLYNKPVTDAVNILNNGQVPGLPSGACVETLGVVDGLGVRPLLVDGIPEHLLEVMRPQAVCQKWITEGVLTRDKNMLLQALFRDPQCAPLKPHEVRAMAAELFEANRKFIDF